MGGEEDTPMGVLAEYLKTEGERLRAEKAKHRSDVKEWVDSLNGLFAQFQEWLAASDPEGLIDRTPENIPGQDPSFGEHQVPALKLTLGERTVRFVPRARFVAAMVRPPGSEKPVRAQGLVELRGLGGADYYLFRLPDGWYIQSRAENLRAAGNDVEPVTRDRFEAAVREAL
jgi:hypothetical protein